MEQTERDSMFVIISKCCGDTWKLEKEDENFVLNCASCGKNIGGMFDIKCLNPEGIKCCGEEQDFWQLIYNPVTATYWLECEHCGKEPGGVMVTGPDASGKVCSCCGKVICDKESKE